jgi:hypothetical protein
MKNNPMIRAVAAALFAKDYGEPWREATETARWHWMEMADVAVRAMERSDAMTVLHQLANLLDGLLPLLEEAAERERKDNEGKALKCITQRKRLEVSRQAIDRAFDILGMQHD